MKGYYQNRFKRSFSSEGLTFERLLINWKLADESDGRIVPTNLGVILFSERPERVLNGAYIDIAAYRGTVADGETSDTKRITGPVPEQILQVLQYFQSSPLIATLSRKEATGRRDLPAYVDIALQEAVVNAVVHRDYELHRLPDHHQHFPGPYRISKSRRTPQYSDRGNPVYRLPASPAESASSRVHA